MPKMKTHRGAAKRFKKTGSGKLKRAKAKMNLRQSAVVSEGDARRISQLLPY